MLFNQIRVLIVIVQDGDGTPFQSCLTVERVKMFPKTMRLRRFICRFLLTGKAGLKFN